MADILLEQGGDIYLTPGGDIQTTDSVRQAILIHLRWIWKEWRLGPSLGFPWYEQVFVKNPSIANLRSRIREEVMKVNGVLSCKISDVKYDRRTRRASFSYEVSTTQGLFREEMTLYADH